MKPAYVSKGVAAALLCATVLLPCPVLAAKPGKGDKAFPQVRAVAAKPAPKQKTAALKGPQKQALSMVGKDLKLPLWPDPEKIYQQKNHDRVVTDPDLQLLLHRLRTTAQIWHLPDDYQNVTIEGHGECSREQAVVLLRAITPRLPIKATPEEIVDIYYEEASREGIRWDLAFCQALLETGFFRFGGTVVPEQNNFCGLGTTSASVRGAYFATPRDGARAHIQHLMAYCTPRTPVTPVIDPRYSLVYSGKVRTGFFSHWSQLNGRWATGSFYAEKILRIHEAMKSIIAISGREWKEEGIQR